MAHAGKMRSRVLIQRAAQVKGPSGGFTKAWSNLFPDPIFAAMRHVGGGKRQSTEKGGEISVARTIIEMRYVAGVREEDRVVYQGAAYRILDVNNVEERNKTLILTCETGVAA